MALLRRTFERYLLERIANREVEHHIADIRGTFQIPVGALRLPWCPERNGHIDAKDEDREIETETSASTHSKVLEKTGGKHGAGTAGVGPQRPDIAKIGEHRPADETK